uniref:EF-hand domain-containing protein n=1 Tax=Spironucleus salmonicida TaxID=348837 RepID=V6LII9_9EUKA|eukprot:EST44405.1 Hypothetical protein SS50377_15710 [Spironucleus salmonicida]
MKLCFFLLKRSFLEQFQGEIYGSLCLLIEFFVCYIQQAIIVQFCCLLQVEQEGKSQGKHILSIFTLLHILQSTYYLLKTVTCQVQVLNIQILRQQLVKMGCGNNMKKFVPELEKEASEEQQQDTTLSTLDQVQPQAVQLKSKPKQIDALYQQRLRDFKRISYQNQKLYSSIDTDKKFKVTPSDINRYFISINVMFALSLIQRFLELTGFDSYGPIEFQFLITAIDYFNKYTKFLLIIADNSAVRTPRIKQIIQKGPGTMSMIDQLLDNNTTNLQLLSLSKGLEDKAPEFDDLIKQFSKLHEYQQIQFMNIDINENLYLNIEQIYDFLAQQGYKGKDHDVNIQFYIKCPTYITPQDFQGILSSPNFPIRNQQSLEVIPQIENLQNLIQQFNALSHEEQVLFMEVDTLDEFYVLPIYVYKYFITKLQKDMHLKIKTFFSSLTQIRGDIDGSISNPIGPLEFIQLVIKFNNIINVELKKDSHHQKLDEFIPEFDSQKAKKSNDLVTLLKEFGRLSEQMQEIFEKIDLNEDFLLSPINLFNWMRQNGLEMKLAEYNGFITKQSLNSAGQIRPSEFAQILTKFANMIPNVKLTSQKTAKLQQFADDFSANKSKKSNDFAVLLKEFGALSPMVQTIFETIDDREEFLIAPLSLYNWMKSNGLKMKLGEYNMYIDKKNLNVNNQIRPSEFVEILYTFQKELVKVNLPPLVEESKLNDMALMIGGERMRKSNDLATLLKEFGRLSEQMQEIFEKIDLNEDFLLSPINLFNWMRQNGLEMKLTEYNGFITKQSLNSAGQIRPSEFAQILDQLKVTIPL